MRPYLLALPVLLISIPALACPVPGDLSGPGIKIIDAEGSVVRYHQSGPDMVTATVDYGDGEGTVLQALHGIYTVEFLNTEDGQPVEDSLLRMTYDGGLGALPAPSAGIEITVGSNLDAGSVQTDWNLTYTFGSLEEHTIGDCTFQTIPIELAMEGPLEPVQSETYRYFVAFRFAHLAASGVGTMRFDTHAVSIETANQ